MLKITPDPTFTDDVELTVPGQKEPGTISMTFKYRSRKGYQELLESLEEKKNDKGKVTRKEKTFAEALPEFVLGWGLEEEFNPKNIDIFLNNYPVAYQEIFTHYSKMLLVSRVKN
jgi:hypothetical protein